MKQYLMMKAMGVMLPRHDFFSSIQNMGKDLIGKINGVTWVLVAFAVMGVGAMFIYSSKAREAGKAALPWIIGGALLIYGAIEFANYIQGAAKF